MMKAVIFQIDEMKIVSTGLGLLTNQEVEDSFRVIKKELIRRREDE